MNTLPCILLHCLGALQAVAHAIGKEPAYPHILPLQAVATFSLEYPVPAAYLSDLGGRQGPATQGTMQTMHTGPPDPGQDRIIF